MLEVLVKRAKDGDAEAFAQLFAQFEVDLYKMAYVFVCNEVTYRSIKYIQYLLQLVELSFSIRWSKKKKDKSDCFFMFYSEFTKS